VVAVCSIPLALASGSFVISLQGQSRFTRLATANALNTVVSTVVVVVLVVLFGLNGAIAAVILTSLTTLLVFVAREPRLFARISLRPSFLFERRTLRAIYAFAAASVVLSVLSVAADLVTRTLIVHRLGLSFNGLYQPVVVLSSQFFLALVAALAMYLFPRLTELYADGRLEEALAEINSGLRLVLSVIVPAIVLVVAFAPSLLVIAFSHEFRNANIPLDIQMVGDVLRTLGWVLGAVFLPLGLVQVWLWIGVATLVAQVGLSAALVGPFGLNGIAAAYTGAWAVNAGLALFLGHRRCGLSLERATKRYLLAALGIPAVALALAVVSPNFGLLTSFLLLCAWFGLTLRRPAVSALVMAMRGRR
jgi:PST family polysaccharide transporter